MIKDSNLGSKKTLIQSIISAEPVVYGAAPTSAVGVKFAFHSGDAIANGSEGQIVFNKLGDTGAIVINGELVSSKILDITAAQKTGAETGTKTVTVKYVGANNAITTSEFEVIDQTAVESLITVYKTAADASIARLDASVNALETYVAATNISSSKKDIVVTATEGTTGKTYDVSVNIDGATIIRSDEGVLSAGKSLAIRDAGEGETAGHKFIIIKNAAQQEESKIDIADLVATSLIQSVSYNSADNSLTINWKSETGDEATKIDLKELLDINDLAIKDDSSNYLSFTTDASTGQFGAKIADVSTAADGSTGLADAWLVKQYVDSKSTDLAVSAAGDDYITAAVDATNNKKINVSADVQDVTGSKGTAGAYDDEGAQTTAPTHGTLVGVENALMDSKQAIEKVKDYVDGEVAIEAARADANVLAAVKALDQADASVSATNVAFNYGVTDGITHINGLKVDYATVTKTATTSTAATPATDAALTVTNGSQLATGSDIEKVAQYAADKVTEEAHRVDKKIADLAGNVTSTKTAGVQTQVTTAAGQVSTVVVSVDDNAVTVGGDKDARTIAATTNTAVLKGDAIAQIKTFVENVAADASANAFASAKAALDSSIAGLDADKTSDDAAVATVQVVEVDGKISDVVVTNISAGVNRTGDAAGARVLAATTATGAVTGADIALIKDYVDNVVSDFQGAADSSVTVSDASSFITTKINFVDGALTATESSLSYVKAVYNAESNAVTTNGLADGQWVLDVVNDRINDLDATVACTSTNVNVEIVETDGVLASVVVSEDYATITKTDAVLADNHLSITTANALTVASGDGDKLVKASDLSTVYAAAKDAAKADLTVALTWAII